MKKKIVITGGLGYIGTELCKIYSGESWNNEIIVIDKNFFSDRVNQLTSWNIKFFQGNIIVFYIIRVGEFTQSDFWTRQIHHHRDGFATLRSRLSQSPYQRLVFWNRASRRIDTPYIHARLCLRGFLDWQAALLAVVSVYV